MEWTAQWMKVVSDPLGLAGFALCLVFSISGRAIAKSNGRFSQRLVQISYALAAICVLGGLTLAYHHEVTKTAAMTAPAPQPSMKIDKIDQKVDNGAAVAGVQGTVTVTNSAPPTKEPDKK